MKRRTYSRRKREMAVARESRAAPKAVRENVCAAAARKKAVLHFSWRWG